MAAGPGGDGGAGVSGVGSPVCAWDLGGAHVKLACADGAGRLSRVLQRPLALWRGPGALEALAGELLADLPPADGEHEHVVTMTGELADCFVDRREGVARLLAQLQGALGDRPLRVFAGPAGLLAPEAALRRPEAVASANWYASAAWLAGQAHPLLLVDMGSTTTDIIEVGASGVHNEGYTDAERLASEELLYLGAVRTPLAALAARAPLAGRWQNLMTETFATTGDVLVAAGELDAAHLSPWTADGRPADRRGCTARIARMLGRDGDALAARALELLVAFFRERLLAALLQSLLVRLGAGGGAPRCLVGAGCGRALVREAAARLGLGYRDFAECLAGVPPELAAAAAECAPVAALTQLALDARR